MTARVTPYLNFGGDAREAMEFYQSIFGGTLDITTFADLHRAQDAGQANLIAHSMLKGTTGVILMASDVPKPGERKSASISVALGGDEADLTEYWGGFPKAELSRCPSQSPRGVPYMDSASTSSVRLGW